MKHLTILFFVISLLFGCGINSEPTFQNQVENGHALMAFRGHKAISFDLQMTYKGNKSEIKTYTISTNNSWSMLEFKDGKKVIQRGSLIYCSPEFESYESARSSLLTFSYFFMFPYKLSDPGTNWAPFESKTTNDDNLVAEKLSFNQGVGDAPEDWYIAFADPELSMRLDHVAYIVTGGSRSQKEAEEAPHAIKYEDYQHIEGIPISTKWKIFEWTSKSGLTKEIGSGILSNVRFIDMEAPSVPDDFMME